MDLESSGPFWIWCYRGTIKHAKLPVNQPAGPEVGEDSAAAAVEVLLLTAAVLVEAILEGAAPGVVGRLHHTFLYMK